MYKPKLEKDIRCPLEYGLAVFGGKWKSRVICVLSQQSPIRYSDMRGELYDVTDAALAVTLKELLTDGIIERKQYDEMPLRVEYKLTAKGKTVVPMLQSICQWSGVYYNKDSNKSLTQCQKCNYKRK